MTGGGYDEADKKTLPEDFVDPGTSLRFGGAYPVVARVAPRP